jgi:heme exporter protein A
VTTDAAFPALSAPRFARVEAREVTRCYGRDTALHRCSFAVTAGEVLAVIGPNGAGKSTLLSILSTHLKPSEGKVVVDGRLDAWADRQRVRAEIGLVAHDSMLYGDLTGRENLALAAGLHGVEQASVAAWLAAVGLEKAADAAVRTYSRGMRQRLSIARALIHSPSLVLLDEPLTGLDPEAQALFERIARWLRRERRMVIVVTHALEADPTIFDRVLVLERGRVRADERVSGGLGETWSRVFASPTEVRAAAAEHGS